MMYPKEKGGVRWLKLKFSGLTIRFNPWIGCTKVHAGCTHCYAERDFDTRRGVAQWGPHGTRVVTSEANWRKPLAWNRAAERDFSTAKAKWVADCCAGYKTYPEPQPLEFRRRVFCASLADVFEDWDGRIHDSSGNALWTNKAIGVFEVDDGAQGFAYRRHWTTLDEVRRRLFALIDATPWLDWQLLTKRPENIGRMWPEVACDYCDEVQCGLHRPGIIDQFFRHNVWLGTSVSDQETANRMIPELLKCRALAPALFASAEPLLGPIDLDECGATPCDVVACPDDIGPVRSSGGLDWLIVGGESGPQARPCYVEWVQSIVQQCDAAGVPCFVKQLGSDAAIFLDGNSQTYDSLALCDKKGGDPEEWPQDLRVREFPGDQ